MGLFEIIAILLTLSALFSFINYRFIGLPTTIGVMLIGLLCSLTLIGFGTAVPGVNHWAHELLAAIDFDQTLLHGMLSFLLFAGALHVNINDLRGQSRLIAGLATIGVAISTFIIGTLFWLLMNSLGFTLPYLHALLFGALISPTDPIAVMGIIKTVGLSKSLETKIVGESLFNDGVGVVIFLVLLGIASGEGGHTDASAVGLLFLQEAVGGCLFGFLSGYVTYRLLRQVDQYEVEVLLTLALVSGCYVAAEALHLSAPIAIVVAGLFIGNHGRSFAMSAKTREHLDTFWALIDEILNVVLFVLIGLEVIVIHFGVEQFKAILVTIPVVLISRFVSVLVPVNLLRMVRSFSPHVIKIMTWSGLRGGISVALALSLPAHESRDLIVAVTYGVVVFSIVVQGLTVGPFLNKLGATRR